MRFSFLWLIAFLCSAICAKAQVHYTAKKFQDTVFTDIVYGSDTSFDGSVTTLKLDIYKPLNDSNCKRPVLLAVHGGAWLAGDKSDAEIKALCHEFAARGYVVASVNYRMGMQPAGYYVPYAICPQARCTYVADSAEYYRASFRAVQDVKGAIRFMKSRYAIDSSDINNVYLLGASAGAYTVNGAAFMDQESERPAGCGALANAPTPDSDLSSCIASGGSKLRPDLGSVHGKLNLGVYNAKVQGVASFFGGVWDPGIFANADASDTPDLYMFHQTCDVVVDNNKGRIFWKVYYYCYDPVNLCMPFSSGPVSYGSSAIKQHLDTGNSNVSRVKFTLLTAKGAYSCNASDNCHGIDNTANRSAEIASFFSERISKTNTPGPNSCATNSVGHTPESIHINAYPNPFSGAFRVSMAGVHAREKWNFVLKSTLGQTLWSEEIEMSNSELHLGGTLPPGVYVLCISHPYFNYYKCIPLVKKSE